MAAEREVTLRFMAAGASEVRVALAEISKTSAEAGTSLDQLNQKSKDSSSSLSEFNASAGSFVTTIGVGVVGAVGAATTAFLGFTAAAAGSGGPISDLRNQLSIAAGGAKEMDEATRKLKEATEGQVSGTVLQQALLKTLGGASKVTSDQLATLAQAIFTVSKPTGDFESNFNAVVSGLARGNPRALLMIRGFEGLRGAMRDATEEAKKQGVELTAQQENQLLITEAMKIAEQQQKKFGSSSQTVSDIITQATTSFNSFITEIQVAVTESKPLQNALLTIGDIFKTFGLDSESTGKFVGEVIGEMAAKFINFAVDAGAAITEFTGGFINGLGFVVEKAAEFGFKVNEVFGAIADFAINSIEFVLDGFVFFFDTILAAAREVAGVFDDDLAASIESTRIALSQGVSSFIEDQRRMATEGQQVVSQFLTGAVEAGRRMQKVGTDVVSVGDKIRETARISRELRARGEAPVRVDVNITGGRQEAERVGREVGEAVRQEVQGLLTSEELLRQSVDEGLAAALAATGG